MRFLSSSLILLLFIAVGCESSTTDPDTDPNPTASLSFVVGDASSLTKSLSGHVTVQSAKILLKTIKFHSVDENDSSEFRTDAIIVDLDLTGGLNEIGVSNIAPGTYNKVSFKLHKPDDENEVDDTDFFDSDTTGGNGRYSVVVTGLHDTTAFTYKSRATANQRVEFDPPLVITDTTTTVNVTLLVDVNSWFINGNMDLDPNDSHDEQHIDRAIRASFRGFVDNQHRGHQD